jgi:hypothetical protein
LQFPERQVEAELLDQLPPDDRRARAARADLRRIHRVMGTLGILRDAIARLALPAPPRRILELGAGDGSLMLRLARALRWSDVELTLLDRQDLLDAGRRRAFEACGWRVRALPCEVFDWARSAPGPKYDLVVTTLFLHHFEFSPLRVLCAAVAARTDAFVACEPRRGRLAVWGSHLVGFLGANAVTRGDAVKSVAAGFADRELERCWPVAPAAAERRWIVEEYETGLFTHCLTAARAR